MHTNYEVPRTAQVGARRSANFIEALTYWREHNGSLSLEERCALYWGASEQALKVEGGSERTPAKRGLLAHVPLGTLLYTGSRPGTLYRRAQTPQAEREVTQ